MTPPLNVTSKILDKLRCSLGLMQEAHNVDGKLVILKQRSTIDPPRPISAQKFKLSSFLFQGINDYFNQIYIGEHNIGFVSINKRKIQNFFVKRGRTQKKRRGIF